MQIHWYERQDDVLAFARIMCDDSRIKDTKELLYYFEKPYKWDREHKIWEDFECPTEDDGERWNEFSEAISELWYPSVK